MKSILDVEVSIFKSYKKPDNPEKVNLLTWLQSDEYKKEVEHIRSISNKKERDKIKATLPGITPSGEFSYRNEKGLIHHSGFICLDIDYKGNEWIGNFNELKEQLSKIKNVAYCGLSVSGKGYFILIKIEQPDKHEQHFKQLKIDINTIFRNIAKKQNKLLPKEWSLIDENCKDVSRLRGYSYDDKAYFNHQATVYKRLSKLQRKPNAKPFAPKATADQTKRKVEKLINEITKHGIDITQSYVHWFQIGCSLANEFGEGGREYFHLVSQYHYEYLEIKTNKQFDECLKHNYKYSIGTFFKYCNDAGIKT